MSTRRLTAAALLLALSLILFIIELQIPSPVPIPGVKLGLANIVTVYALFVLTPQETLLILLGRILLGAMFAGQLMSLLFSLCGGLMCFAVMLILRCFLTRRQMWACSAIGAVFHNLGQLLAAVWVTRTAAVLLYLPPLLISGVLTGLFTGLCAQFTLRRIDLLNRKKER